ncbi:MAG: polyphosphate glucokinase [Pseudomonadota bacterium]|jgi:polyphosphate glucokinase
MHKPVLGIDVGGSSIKAALVDVASGNTVSDVGYVLTPRPSTPSNLLEAFVQLDRQLGGEGPLGLALPCVVQHGVTRTAANIDKGWIDFDCRAALQERLGRPVTVLNDADAAGLAEVRWGAGQGTRGVVIVLTFGTGIGSAIFNDGVLLPNTEFGHLEMLGGEAEHYASARVRTAQQLDWPAWAARVNAYLARMHGLFWPDLFILGGAVTENYEHFAPLLQSPAPIRAARFAGQSGIVGAALAASLTRG